MCKVISHKIWCCLSPSSLGGHTCVYNHLCYWGEIGQPSARNLFSAIFIVALRPSARTKDSPPNKFG